MLRAIAISLLLLSTASETPAFAQRSSAGTIIDDLMPAIWERLEQGKSREVVAHSRRLLREDLDNALALATLIDAGALANDETALDLGERGLRTAGQLRHPRGMSEDEYLAMMKRVRLILNSAVGKAYIERNDPVAARRYLKEAVALAPGNAQNAYLAARAYLEGAKPDPQTGYWLLARTVVLTQGTPAGDRLAKYAWEQFWGAGGSEQAWKDYLAVAGAGAPKIRTERGVEVARTKPLAPELAPDVAKGQAAGATASSAQASAIVSPIPSAQGAANATPTSSSQPGVNVSPTPSTQAGANVSPMLSGGTTPNPTLGSSASASASTTPSAKAPQQNQAAGATQPEVPQPRPVTEIPSRSARTLPESEKGTPPDLPVEIAENRQPSLPSPNIRRPNLSPEAPISLGILIEASVASRENRASVIYALSDMLRHLRENDEAFIVAYGRNVGMEQDLTWNYDLLEKAMDRIDHQPGAALLEAVAFSAGHLARVARNPNRVLLVVSDGTNEVGKANPLEHAAEIRASGARIYCIGLGVPGSGERNRLQELASRTGGSATFVDDPRAFRGAAHTIASNLGIDFPE
jgi:hypothetical protein